MDPDSSGGQVPGAVKRAVQSFHLAPNFSQLDKAPTEIVPPGDKDFNLNAHLMFDVVGVAFKVGFLKIEPFEWSASLKPLPLSTDALNAVDNVVQMLEINPSTFSACKIAAWGTATAKKVFHIVMYIRKFACQQAYCDYNDYELATTFHVELVRNTTCASSQFTGVSPALQTRVLLCSANSSEVVTYLRF
uniref:CCA-adding enzyme n=1 Tax=Lygus hesperus TaxID=30085 RepID=A0A0A9YXL5_LYGHE